jgi:hypothetical protein
MSGPVCYGEGGSLIPGEFTDQPDLWADWSHAYPGSPPPPTPWPAGDLPDLRDMPPAGTDMDSWAKGLLSQAFYDVIGHYPDPAVVQLIQALSKHLTNYGWPGFPTGKTAAGRDTTPWWGHHNFGVMSCAGCFDGQRCVAGFLDQTEVHDQNGWQIRPACFAHYPTNLGGAQGLVRHLLGSSEVWAAVQTADSYALAVAMRQAGMTRRRQDAGLEARELAAAIQRAAQSLADVYGAVLVSSSSPSVPAIDPTEPPGLTQIDLPTPRSRTALVVGAAATLVAGALAVRWWVRRSSK